VPTARRTTPHRRRQCHGRTWWSGGRAAVTVFSHDPQPKPTTSCSTHLARRVPESALLHIDILKRSLPCRAKPHRRRASSTRRGCQIGIGAYLEVSTARESSTTEGPCLSHTPTVFRDTHFTMAVSCRPFTHMQVSRRPASTRRSYRNGHDRMPVLSACSVYPHAETLQNVVIADGRFSDDRSGVIAGCLP
jgi:hypothetical protein